MDEFPIHQLPHYVITDRLGMVSPVPKQLFARGSFPTDPHIVLLTVVGSRRVTPYGAEACRKLIAGLRGYPVIIVSGLAVGIDTIAHETAIENGITTMAFPGSGLAEKSIYPRSNMKLVEKILQSGGCIVSELGHDTKGNSWTFPARNRLMAGIAKATLLVEGSHTSGSRITARLATEYNRDVLAVPGPLFTESSEAPNSLIRMGAAAITCSEDILEALGFQVTEQAPLDLFSLCTEDEASILKRLASPRPRGDLIREMQLPTHQANVLLTQMEMKGLIREEFGSLRRN